MGLKLWLGMLASLIGVSLLLFALVVGPWLLTRHPQHGLTSEEELKAKNDVRTTLVQTLAGLAVAGGLLVTYRTFQHNRVEQDRSYRLRQAEQVNEFSAKAFEQLGHEKAPVRLGALYSLVNIAQNNPHQRQTVVDVICSYLRMPYPFAESAEPITQEGAQELQVRLTAQRLLAEHLRVPAGVAVRDAQQLEVSPELSFWPGMKIHLAGADLFDFSLKRSSVVGGNFSNATFRGDVEFNFTAFDGYVDFSEATFAGGAFFGGAMFRGEAAFPLAMFRRQALFRRAHFSRKTSFAVASFSVGAIFSECEFRNAIYFDEAKFYGLTSFASATFAANVYFGGTSFSGGLSFALATVLQPHKFRDENGYPIVRVWPEGWALETVQSEAMQCGLVRVDEPPLPDGG
ncbi:pentapeptide repeat-containing protein [Micromonospora chalcea]